MASLSTGYLKELLNLVVLVAVIVILSNLLLLRGSHLPRQLAVPVVHVEEEDFPIAFSVLTYTDLDRTLRLIQAIYRPHNCYCIHVDRKTDELYYNALTDILRRLYGRSVYVVPREDSIRVKWGRMSTLDADLLCSRILLDRCPLWKYWINLTGQEFPLRTNWELVRALTLLNGSNLIDATYRYRNMDRFPRHQNLDFPLTWYKGSAHIAARREFVQFVHKDERAKNILQVLRDFEQAKGRAIIADETYFPTLNHNPTSVPVPGAFLGVHEWDVFKSPIRIKLWIDQSSPCLSGIWVRGICMLGLHDVEVLKDRPELFANKFTPLVEPEGYAELERWLAEKVLYEATHGRLHPSFNATHYLSLELRWNHL